jgi:hypothetical protein
MGDRQSVEFIVRDDPPRCAGVAAFDLAIAGPETVATDGFHAGRIVPDGAGRGEWFSRRFHHDEHSDSAANTARPGSATVPPCPSCPAVIAVMNLSEHDRFSPPASSQHPRFTPT